jgi:hypothetical protein
MVLGILALSIGNVGAQEAKRFSLGLGLEGNFNTRTGFVLGESIHLDFGIIDPVAVGIKAGFNHDFNEIMVIEPAAYGRWYFLIRDKLAFFIQGDLGLSIIFEGSSHELAPLGGLSAGMRVLLKDWYVEPYVRGGYPFMWGAGVSAGYRFK